MAVEVTRRLFTVRDDFYAQSQPEPQDVLLAVEVAETSLAFDRDKKIPLYARAGKILV